MRAKHSSIGVVIFLSLAACASTPGLGAAERGDYAELKSDLKSPYDRGQLTNDDAAKIAKAVASHEIAKAAGNAGQARVRELAACAHELDDPLSDRMKTRDAIGAEAAQDRLDSGELSPSD